jgi:hypothetical protein
MLGHADLEAIDGHECSGCHVPSRAADAIHNGCTRCHEDVESFAFFTRSRDDHETVCRTCHMRQ